MISGVIRNSAVCSEQSSKSHARTVVKESENVEETNVRIRVTKGEVKESMYSHNTCYRLTITSAVLLGMLPKMLPFVVTKAISYLTCSEVTSK